MAGDHRWNFVRGLMVMLAAALVACHDTNSGLTWPTQVVAPLQLDQGRPLDEAYRHEFQRCDEEDVFQGIALEGARRCSNDPNRFERFLVFEDGTILTESKLGIDLDGTPYACNTPGQTDACPTWLMLPDATGQLVPVNGDVVPYVVIPIAGAPTPELNAEFRNSTGVGRGDFGVAIRGETVVPVIVADGGPFNKYGEGSPALHRAFGRELCAARNDAGDCTRFRAAGSIGADVTIVLFPGSRVSGLTAENVAARTTELGLAAWNTFLAGHDPMLP